MRRVKSSKSGHPLRREQIYCVRARSRRRNAETVSPVGRERLAAAVQLAEGPGTATGGQTLIEVYSMGAGRGLCGRSRIRQNSGCAFLPRPRILANSATEPPGYFMCRCKLCPAPLFNGCRTWFARVVAEFARIRGVSLPRPRILANSATEPPGYFMRRCKLCPAPLFNCPHEPLLPTMACFGTVLAAPRFLPRFCRLTWRSPSGRG